MDKQNGKIENVINTIGKYDVAGKVPTAGLHVVNNLCTGHTKSIMRTVEDFEKRIGISVEEQVNRGIGPTVTYLPSESP